MSSVLSHKHNCIHKLNFSGIFLYFRQVGLGLSSRVGNISS